MRNVTLKGLLAKKARLLLIALAVVLRTAFLSATGVLSPPSGPAPTTFRRDGPPQRRGGPGGSRLCGR